MGIFHEVQPKEKSLDCKDCHDTGKRMDWKALGFAGDPAGGVASQALSRCDPPAAVAGN